MINFKKVASVITSAVMLGSTAGIAAAAAYPAPFVEGGAADGAVVVGANAASSDWAAALDLSQSLNAGITAAGAAVVGGTTVTGGDFVKLERTQDKFNLGNDMADFYASLDESELSVVLAEGIYQNDANDEFDFEQEIVLGPLVLQHFVDSDLDPDEVPVIGFDLSSGNFIMNYTLEFTPDAAEGGATDFNELETTDITLLGRTYYVAEVDASSSGVKMTLLDTANSVIVSQGETVSIEVGGVSYDVSITFINSADIIFDVSGVETNKMSEGDVFKIGEDLYIAVKNNLFDEKETGTSKADISIGSGKIVLESNQEVEINNEDVSENTVYVLNSYITNTSEDIEEIVLEWLADDDVWITSGEEIVLPGFETIKISMGGFNTPKQEDTIVDSRGDDSLMVKTTITDGLVDFDLFFLNSTNTGIEGLGEKDNHLLVSNASTATGAGKIFLQLNETENSYFAATWIDGDDSESYIYEIGSIDFESGKNVTTLKNEAAGGSDIKFSQVTDDADAGQIRFVLEAANDAQKTATVSLSPASSGTVYADRIVTAEGMLFKLPVDTSIVATTEDNGLNLTDASEGTTTWIMNFTEEDDNDNIATGGSVQVTMDLDDNDGPEPSSLPSVSLEETGDDTDKFEGYVVSDLATKFLHDKPTTGLSKLTVTYHGTEAFADVFVSESGAAISGEALAGVAAAGGQVIVVKDSEVSSVADRNLVVVGGSCINTAAASLLGSDTPVCGSDFSDLTNVGAGQYLIQVFANPWAAADSGKIAMLVAGYNAADTTNAAAAAKDGVTTDLDTTMVGPTAG